jgi:hypothetical protein
MYLVKTPKFIQGLFPNYVWRVPNQKKVLYLTFDDGPNEKVTPWVLDQLAQFNAKATFFCVGKQIDFYPEIHQNLYEVDIDFDLASAAWRANKRSMGDGSFKYKDNRGYAEVLRHCGVTTNTRYNLRPRAPK